MTFIDPVLPTSFWRKLWFCGSSSTGRRDDNPHLLADSQQFLNGSNAFHLATLSIYHKQRNKENLRQENHTRQPCYTEF